MFVAIDSASTIRVDCPEDAERIAKQVLPGGAEDTRAIDERRRGVAAPVSSVGRDSPRDRHGDDIGRSRRDGTEKGYRCGDAQKLQLHGFFLTHKAINQSDYP